MFGFGRRKKASLAIRYPTTPEGFTTLTGTLSEKQHLLLSTLSKRAGQAADQAKRTLASHDRTAPVIRVADQRDANGAIGTRRSVIGLLLFGGPASGVLLSSFHHVAFGGALALAAIVTALALRHLNQRRMSEMELEPDELKALSVAAAADPVARQQMAMWRKEGHPFTQRDYTVVETWLWAKERVQLWERVNELHRPTKPARRPGRR